MDRQIFVAGTWREQPAVPYADAARTIGARVAGAGFSLACGPGTGISRYVIDGFRSVDGRAGRVRFFLPRAELMEAVGEVAGDGADEIVHTAYDYPMRNLHHVSLSCGLIAVTGGDGTLEEILPALIDYGLPVGVLRSSGTAAAAVEALLPIFPAWTERVLLDEDPAKIVEFVLERAPRLPELQMSALPRV